MRLPDHREIGRADVERAGQALGLANEGEAAVVGHVQPLVAVGDHRVGALHALRQVPRGRRQAREQAERSVHVQPGSVALGQIGHRRDRIEVAGVHLAGVGHDDRRRPVERIQLSFERGQVQAAHGVGGQPADVPWPQPSILIACTALGWM